MQILVSTWKNSIVVENVVAVVIHKIDSVIPRSSIIPDLVVDERNFYYVTS